MERSGVGGIDWSERFPAHIVPGSGYGAIVRRAITHNGQRGAHLGRIFRVAGNACVTGSFYLVVALGGKNDARGSTQVGVERSAHCCATVARGSGIVNPAV